MSFVLHFRSTLRRRAACGLMASAFLLLSLPAGAQNGNASLVAQQRRAEARQDAYHAFKNGNAVAAAARIASGVDRGPGARDADLQEADDLADLSCIFANEGSGALAGQVATLALVKITTGRGRVPQREAASAVALSGQLYEQILRDPARARAAYEQALQLDPMAKGVAERLAHLNAVAARAAEKTAANEMLRQRAREAKR